MRLKNLVDSKATGTDKTPVKIRKMTADIIAPSLSFVFNMSLNSDIYIYILTNRNWLG